MADEKKDSEKLDAIMSHLKDSDEKINKRIDAMEANYADSMKKIDAACGRMDAFEKKEGDDEDKKKADAAKKDAEEAEKAKADAAKKDAEEEEKKKADAAKADAAGNTRISELEAKIAALHAQIPAAHGPEDRPKFIAAQMAAEPVYQAFGDSAGAPAPINGENLAGYKRRLLGKYKEHSPGWKGIDLSDKGLDVLELAERQIYADAATAANTVAVIGAGKLQEYITTDRTGRRISNFKGDPKACWGDFTQEPFRITGFNKPSEKHPAHLN